eukprot:34467_1
MSIAGLQQHIVQIIGANDTPGSSITKKDPYGFFCYHEIKNMKRKRFIELCLNRQVMWLVPKTPHMPRHIYFSGLCIQCAVDMVKDTGFLSVFDDTIPIVPIDCAQNPNLQSHDELDKFLDISHHIKFFLCIVAVPSVFKCIMSTKHLFTRLIIFMSKADFYAISWVNCMNNWHFSGKIFEKGSFEKHFEHHVCDILDRQEELQKVFYILFHYGKTMQHLRWILSANDGQLFVEYVVVPFLHMMQYKDEIDLFVDPPWTIYYFAIYASKLVFKYKDELNLKGMKEWTHVFKSKMAFQYYGSVIATFDDKDNKVKKVYRRKNNYVDDIVTFRNRVFCNNPKCKVDYYRYKYDTTFGSKKMWDSYGKPLRKWYRCKRCTLVYYCCRKCQKYDWVKFNHRDTCNQLLKLKNEQ